MHTMLHILEFVRKGLQPRTNLQVLPLFKRYFYKYFISITKDLCILIDKNKNKKQTSPWTIKITYLKGNIILRPYYGNL